MGQPAVHIDEHLLIERLIAGDPGARELLYDYYGPALYSIILQVVPDNKKAEDILTTVFVRIYSDIYTYKESGNTLLFGWMMRLTREIVFSDGSYAGGEVTEGVLLQGNNSLQRFTNTLPQDKQKVFYLCYFKGLPKEAVARMMGVEAETVAGQMKEIMMAFRNFLRN
ncbi:RNA polymerase sigma factor [Chitinophaga silvisoli]|uniref:Sigma-70 family RNA polymerase sigma factor n=1 Tax=Chitinophaga silvisoli TaxID=2291814 RepID=A0A3E1P677_9BACT|nr:sigma-70 family RNA polymerase sigma factor [Chitinophaga silvisoli]RFM35696.1 sigma-70 family RNA polymerase sigma factor [Chitinophaga silvisoli]